jgi:hypothetical protein
MSLKTRVFLLTHPGTAVETQKRALLERHHAAIERVLGKAKSLQDPTRRRETLSPRCRPAREA